MLKESNEVWHNSDRKELNGFIGVSYKVWMEEDGKI